MNPVSSNFVWEKILSDLNYEHLAIEYEALLRQDGQAALSTNAGKFEAVPSFVRITRNGSRVDLCILDPDMLACAAMINVPDIVIAQLERDKEVAFFEFSARTLLFAHDLRLVQ